MKYSIIFSLCLAIILTSCGSDNPPVIEITNPVAEEVSFGETITFSGSITDDQGIISWSYQILELAESIEPFIETTGTNTDTQFSGSYIINEGDVNSSMLTFRVTANDEGGNTTIVDRGIGIK